MYRAALLVASILLGACARGSSGQIEEKKPITAETSVPPAARSALTADAFAPPAASSAAPAASAPASAASAPAPAASTSTPVASASAAAKKQAAGTFPCGGGTCRQGQVCLDPGAPGIRSENSSHNPYCTDAATHGCPRIARNGGLYETCPPRPSMRPAQ